MLFFNLGARWSVWSTPRPGRFTHGKKSDIHCTGGLVRPRGRSGRIRKISPSPEFDPRTVQSGSESLYRQSYPDPNFLRKPLQSINITYSRFNTRLVFLLRVSARPASNITWKIQKAECFVLTPEILPQSITAQ